jgi:rhodanese-related sulfurtransferase
MIRTLCVVAVILAAAYAIQAYRGVHTPSTGPSPGRLVPVASTTEVLNLIKQGKKVVFVDAREKQEWREEHIPGAINVSLREVRQLDQRTLGDPDLVVAYCLKDFRGFEVAKALRQSGVNKALILAELGINGWKRQGLPTVVMGKRSETEARVMLDECAHDKSKCQVKTP